METSALRHLLLVLVLTLYTVRFTRCSLCDIVAVSQLANGNSTGTGNWHSVPLNATEILKLEREAATMEKVVDQYVLQAYEQVGSLHSLITLYDTIIETVDSLYR